MPNGEINFHAQSEVVQSEVRSRLSLLTTEIAPRHSQDILSVSELPDFLNTDLLPRLSDGGQVGRVLRQAFRTITGLPESRMHFIAQQITIRDNFGQLHKPIAVHNGIPKPLLLISEGYVQPGDLLLKMAYRDPKVLSTPVYPQEIWQIQLFEDRRKAILAMLAGLSIPLPIGNHLTVGPEYDLLYGTLARRADLEKVI